MKHMARKKSSGNDLKASAVKTIKAPKLEYGPAKSKYRPAIGLIGCGGISQWHLTAYKAAGYNVVALCDLILERAEKRRDEFFPKADVYTDYKELLARKDMEVVDIATHPKDREYLVPAALNAKKHVLSQKPFVMDLELGRKFDALAKKNKVKLAVNQNGRWAPYFSYLRSVVNAGLVGEPMAVHLACHWDHNWIKGTPFDGVHHVVLYDFAIHYFDMLNCLMKGKKATRVTASLSRAPGQEAKPPLLGQAMVEFADGSQSTLVFDAGARVGSREIDTVIGTEGYVEASGEVCAAPHIRLRTAEGLAELDVPGSWFPTGFHGSMAELIAAIAEDREPINNPLDNLKGLAICFAAVQSAESGKPVKVGKATTVPFKRCSAPSQAEDGKKAGKAKKSGKGDKAGKPGKGDNSPKGEKSGKGKKSGKREKAGKE